MRHLSVYSEKMEAKTIQWWSFLFSTQKDTLEKCIIANFCFGTVLLDRCKNTNSQTIFWHKQREKKS